MISADRRNTKDTKTKPLTDAERIRRVVLPENLWGSLEATINAQRSNDLTSILRDALKRIASDRLADRLAEDNYLTREVESEDYTVASLLAWSVDSASSRGSITFTRDEVTSWFATSATRASIATKHAANVKLAGMLALVEKRLGALAAKNHGIATAEDARRLLALIASEDATGDRAALVTDIQARISHIIKALDAKSREDDVGMSDI